MQRSSAIKQLDQMEKDIEQQSDKVNLLQRESLAHGYSSKGKKYEEDMQNNQKVLQKMNMKYQQELQKASKILRKI